MGKPAKRVFRAAIVVPALLGCVAFASAQYSFAQESGLLNSEILQSPVLQQKKQTVSEKLKGKSASERANIKSAEIAKSDVTGTYPLDGITIEIRSIEQIDGGVQIFARAWKDGTQIGFGSSGTTEWERFLIYNPPILVDDPSGEISRELEVNKQPVTRHLREDPVAAIRTVLAHTISVAGQVGANIVPGSVGNTTSTFYPDAGTGGTSVDGMIFWDAPSGTGDSWTNVHNASTCNVGVVRESQASDNLFYLENANTQTNWLMLARSFLLFDTSAIPDAATISSSTLSIYGSGKSDTLNISPSVSVYATTPASNNDLVCDDYDQIGTSELATPISYSNFSTSGYNNFTLNATGTASISKTGITKLGTRNAQYDAANVEPSTSAGARMYANMEGYYADETGTANDPTLVVVHNSEGSVATNLLTNGQTNPTNLSGATPDFSAIYNDPDASDVAASYQIQVATTSGFTSAYWDSGKTALASSTPQGTRSPDIAYGGSALASSTTYYWRIKFWDEADVAGPWSTETATFSLNNASAKVRKSVNESVTSSISAQPDNELGLSVSSNATYIVDGVIFATSTSATPDLLIRFSGPSGSVINIGYTSGSDEEMLTGGVTSSRIPLSANTPKSVHFTGTIKTAGTAGGITLEWAQATSNAAATTVLRGSTMRIDPI